MTTESKRNTASGGSVLLGAAAGALALGVLASLVGALVSGSAAAYGALAGTVIVVLVFAGGASLVNLVAGINPAASLLIALLTYALQVLLIGMIFFAIAESGLVGDVLAAGWLAGAVIVGTVGWMLCQIVLTTRLRLPAYELTDAGAR
ncbi:hypothetical protein ncot_13090 [Nocardioides sp. JQ2195]|uniref:hypothetical protein n=1 Tax=Nocardioides sp. JQ2195 TaxID=2592334 RepID=UPI00143EBB86|nr:hypothetical protein [Nocardioides sp. JQ2195]QIX27436.1 hypothetical protein ncot_13090 [Nocardioides sp. JQ2195]